MDKLIVNCDDAMTEYPTGCVLSVKSTTMDAVIPGEDYLIVTKEYEAIRRIQTSDNDGYFMAYSTNTKKHPVYQTPITWTKMSKWLSYSCIINWG